MNAAQWMEDNFSLRGFGIGLAGVLLVLGGMAGYSFIGGPAAITARTNDAAGQTVAIEWNNKTVATDKPPVPPIIPENFVAVDVPTPPADVHTDHTDTPAHPPEIHEKPDPVPVTETPAPDEVAVNTIAVNDLAHPGKPVDGLTETTQQGQLPIIRQSDKLTAFSAYRRPFDRAAAAGKPVISVAVYDLGLSDSATSAAMRVLPPDVSLIMSPYMKSPEIYVTEARKKGFEVWMSLPVEVGNYPFVDPGPHTALIGASEKDNLNKLYWALARATNYVGFVTPPDPAFIKAEQDMRPLMTRIYGRGLAFMDGALMPSLIPQTMAQSMDAAYGTIDIWADSTADRASIADALAQAEQLARQQGYAAVVIRPYPLSYQMIQEWIATLKDKGIILAPLSAQTGR